MDYNTIVASIAKFYPEIDQKVTNHALVVALHALSMELSILLREVTPSEFLEQSIDANSNLVVSKFVIPCEQGVKLKRVKTVTANGLAYNQKASASSSIRELYKVGYEVSGGVVTLYTRFNPTAASIKVTYDTAIDLSCPPRVMPEGFDAYYEAILYKALSHIANMSGQTSVANEHLRNYMRAKSAIRPNTGSTNTMYSRDIGGWV